jgi:hypothetical protein
VKILIAVLSCHSLRYCEQAALDTWVPEVPPGVDYKFFLGRPEVSLSAYEVFLDVDDSFHGVSEKTIALYKWAIFQGYDFVFKSDLDTLVRPRLLLQSGFEKHNYTGGQNVDFASGGAGYWVSLKAMQYVVEGKYEPGPAEDWNIANILREKDITVHHDERYVFRPGYLMDDSSISYHLSSIRQWGKVEYRPQWMYEAWADQKSRNYRTYSLTSTVAPEPVPIKKIRPLRAPPR